MNIKVKEVAELKEEGLISDRDIHSFPNHFIDTVAIIFRNKQEVIEYCRNVLLQKIGPEVLTSIWSCLTGPAKEESIEKGNYGDSIGQMIGIIPDNDEKWLLFKKEDFERYIKPAIE